MHRPPTSRPVAREREAEHDIDQAQAAALIGGQFPALRQAAVEAYATGWRCYPALPAGYLCPFP